VGVLPNTPKLVAVDGVPKEPGAAVPNPGVPKLGPVDEAPKGAVVPNAGAGVLKPVLVVPGAPPIVEVLLPNIVLVAGTGALPNPPENGGAAAVPPLA
jgi:hypothetical protein